jgi:hypothetical protein
MLLFTALSESPFYIAFQSLQSVIQRTCSLAIALQQEPDLAGN